MSVCVCLCSVKEINIFPILFFSCARMQSWGHTDDDDVVCELEYLSKHNGIKSILAKFDAPRVLQLLNLSSKVQNIYKYRKYLAKKNHLSLLLLSERITKFKISIVKWFYDLVIVIGFTVFEQPIQQKFYVLICDFTTKFLS